MDFRKYGKKAAKKAKEGIKNVGDGDLLGELEQGNVDVIDDPSTGSRAKQEGSSDRNPDQYTEGDMIDELEHDIRLNRKGRAARRKVRKRKGEDDLIDDDLDNLF